MVLCLSWQMHAQTPTLINYQAIARNTETGSELANQQIFMQALVRSGGPSGTVVYQEAHDNIETNEFGLFSLQIGGGEPLTGSLADVNWAQGNYWLEIELDAGSGLQSVGSMQLVSVPYAMHANTVTNADDADADPNNELIEELTFNEELSVLSIEDAGGEYEVDLSALIDDADADPANELVEDFAFDNELSVLSLQDAGGTREVNLSSLINDADADPNNERITGIFYGAAANTLTISEGGSNYSTGLGPVDLDIDPANELIDENGLQLLDDNTLQISEAGTLHSVDLTPLTESLAWTYLPDEGIVYNDDSKVGVGTALPDAQLEVSGQGGNNERLLAVKKGADQAVLEVIGDVVQLAPTSTLDLQGKVLNVVRNISSPVEDLDIPLEPNDRYIIANSGENFDLIMPPAADNPGRRLTVHRAGNAPVTGWVITLKFAEQFDFNPGSTEYEMDDFFTETKEFLSLGADGWIRLR